MASRVVTVERPPRASWMSVTLPTETPEIRTSACLDSCVASLNCASKRQPRGLSGIEPPKASHRNSSSPKHDSANATMTNNRPRVGACFCI